MNPFVHKTVFKSRKEIQVSEFMDKTIKGGSNPPYGLVLISYSVLVCLFPDFKLAIVLYFSGGIVLLKAVSLLGNVERCSSKWKFQKD